MFSIEFTYQNHRHTCKNGETSTVSHKEGFRDTPSSDLNDLIEKIDAGTPWTNLVQARYQQTQPWLYQIITSPTRLAFLDKVLPAGNGLALDIGAGWGQIARPLAVYRPVVALEPVAERLAFIKAAAKQDNIDGNLAFIQSDYLETHFLTRFEIICAIGVLEWSGAFQNQVDPQQRQKEFLRKTRQELALDGSLILGIENRLGLKYLLGCPDDHIGVPNIANLPSDLARKRWQESSGHTLQSFTYSMSELKSLLLEAGFTRIQFWGAFPDYKLPTEIISLDDSEKFNRWLSNTAVPPEHNGYNGALLNATEQETLVAHYQSFAAEGIAHHFVPSFFVRAQ